MKSSRARTLLAVCGAHGIQDGLGAVQFVLLPVLAQSLGLSYAQVGLLKAMSSTAMSLLEIPSAILADKYGEKWLLVVGLAGAGFGYAGVALSAEFIAVCLFFLLAGFGAAFQHSLSSSLLVKTFPGEQRRRALGAYNAFGDVGKLMYTAFFGLLSGFGVGWNAVIMLLALSAIGFAVVIGVLLRNRRAPPHAVEAGKQIKANHWGIRKPLQFFALAVVVFLDSLVQAVFLTFIAFVLIEKGSSSSIAAMGVVLTLTGGTAGKFACGFLAAQYGDRLSFILIQLATVMGMGAVLALPLLPLIFALPLVGVFVQGSSTVCYGSVADHVEDGKASRGYALIYTLASVAAVVGPLLLGWLADRYGLHMLIWSLVVITAITIAFSMSFSLKSAIVNGNPGIHSGD